jgi:DNA-directed RNA polymerase specialized sigma24 family protein
LDRNEFIRACREGGTAIERALRELDRSFFAKLYRIGVQILQDSDAARDLVQDTVIKVWQRCATFRGDSELLPWINVILRHGAIERLRQRKIEVPLEDDQGLTSGAARWPSLLARQVCDPDLFTGRGGGRAHGVEPVAPNTGFWRDAGHRGLSSPTRGG